MTVSLSLCLSLSLWISVEGKMRDVRGVTYEGLVVLVDVVETRGRVICGM